MRHSTLAWLAVSMLLPAIAGSQAPPAPAAAPAAAASAPNEGRQQPGPQLRIESDITYAQANGQPLKLALYRVMPAATPPPVVVWIHGASGALQDHRATPAAALATAGGYAVASIQYRTAPGTSRTAQLGDVKAAIRWLRANAAAYGFDAARIGVFGHDIGGTLAVLAGTTGDMPALEGEGGNATQSSRVQAVIDVAGPMTGGDLNPIAQVSADDAPTLIVHGSADAEVSTRESQSLIAALKVAGIAATLDMPFAVTHDVGDLLAPVVMQNVTSFFNQHLQGVKVAAALSSFMATPPGTYIDPIALDIGGTHYRLYPTPARGPDTYASYRIYLPPGYDSETRRRYPVIYFLHGRSVDSKRPLTAGYIARADAAIRAGDMPPTIIVLAQGLNTGWYLDSEDGRFPMESVIIDNLIPHIDANYRTIARREARAIEGHSMGGYGALHLGFRHPGLFVAVTGNSPALVERNNDNIGSQEYWERQSPSTLAKANVEQLRQQRIRIIVGDKDGLFAVGKKLDELLTELRIDHEFAPVAGAPHNHDQLLQYQTFDTMAFYGEVFGGRNLRRAR